MKITRVVPIHLEETPPDLQEQVIRENGNEDDPVVAEMDESKLIAEKRYEGYKDILYNKKIDSIPWYVASYAFGGVVLRILSSSIIAFVPMQDVIKHRDYEGYGRDIALINLPSAPIYIANLVLTCSYWMNTKCISTMKIFVKTFFSLLICLVVPNAIGERIFTKILNYNLPVPLHSNVSSIYLTPLAQLVIWYQFPKEWRKNKTFIRRFRFFIAAHWTQSLIFSEYTILGKLFIIIPEKYQWILAAVLPILREINTLVLPQLAYQSAGANDTSVTIAVAHFVNTRHVIFLSVTLGTAATDLSSWVILGSDNVYNTYLAIKIV